MTDILRPAEGACLFLLEDAGVFFFEPAQELHAFNTAAAYVWCSLEEGLTANTTVTNFAPAFDVTKNEAQQAVHNLLDDWLKRGYLQAAGEHNPTIHATDRPAAPQTALSTMDRARLTTAVSAPPASTHVYRLLTTTFALRFAARPPEQTVHPILAHLECRTCVTPDVILDIVVDGKGYGLLQDGDPVACCRDLDELAPLVKGHLWPLVINRHRFFMQIHAGVVRNGGACVLVPGAPGSGKTTLTATLIRSGFEYFSDESVLLENHTFEVRPFPISMAVKPGSVPLLSERYPELADLPIHQRADGKQIRYLKPPPEAYPNDIERSHPIGWVVFPRVAVDAPSTLRSLPRIESLHRLMEECLVLPGRLDREQVRGLVQWVRGLQCFELSIGSLDEAVALIQELTHESTAAAF